MSNTADLLAPVRTRLAAVPWQALVPLSAALDAPLAAVLEGRPADRVLDRFLRDHRDLDAHARAACAEAIWGVALWRRHLRALTSPSATPRELLACLAHALGGRADLPALLGVTLPAPQALNDWRDLTSVPDWLALELVRAAGPDAPALAASLDVPAPIYLRANTLRTTRDELAAALAARAVTTRPCRWAHAGLEITSARPNLLGLGLDGFFEVQDEGSQLLAELLAAKPGDEVLDLCAGAGGKSLALAAHVGSTGLVHCADLDASRLDRLRGARLSRRCSGRHSRADPTRSTARTPRARRRPLL